MARPDAQIIGSGPNGLAAAVRLAQQGWSVEVIEASDSPGGGMRTAALTREGFQHDICSAVHPMAVGSPFFRSLPLEHHGVEWIWPDYPLAHPLDDGSAVVLDQSIEKTAMNLGVDARSYRQLFKPLVDRWDELLNEVLAPLHLPRHPLVLTRFGWKAQKSAEQIINQYFEDRKARALFAGLAAHGVMPLQNKFTSAIGLILGIMGHARGWPIPRGGSQRITKALCNILESYGGSIHTDRKITSLQQLSDDSVKIFDLTPRQIVDIAGPHLPALYRYRLQKYKYGPGVFKIDAALDRPVPWSDPKCRKAGTVHVGGNFEEIRDSESAPAKGVHTDHPFVLVAQQSNFDDSRTPDDYHTLWAYCHVPNGSNKDMKQPILNQIERFAPGFKKSILSVHTHNATEMNLYNANYVGGDINGGLQSPGQLFTRPVARYSPYTTPREDIFICSASTPPGGGVHGMCGYHAAEAVLRKYAGGR